MIQLSILQSPFILILLLPFFGAAYLLHYFLKRQYLKMLDESKNSRAQLRKKGVKISVKYDELKIETNSWTQEIQVGSGTRSRNETIDVNHNVIMLKKKHKGHIFKEEYNIDIDSNLLRMKLALQNEIYLYYNPQNYDDFFLDLEFLAN